MAIGTKVASIKAMMRFVVLSLAICASACGTTEDPQDTTSELVDAVQLAFEPSQSTIRQGAIGPFDRGVVLPGLADPDAFVDGDQVYITGTYDGLALPIWRLDEGFVEHQRYQPSAADGAFDYCHVWAPELSRIGESWIIAFAATRVANGTPCSETGLDAQRIFYATAPNDELFFGAPIAPDFGPGAPRSTPESGCPADGCDKALRIDPSLFVDTDERVYLSYTWFDRGNHNATIALDDPSRIIHNTSPSASDEERVNEAPEIFRRGDKYYFLYSAGVFSGRYRLHYIMADSVAELTKDQGTHELTVPVQRRDGRKFETTGHGSIVEYQGSFFAIYHVSGMDEAGNITARSTAVSPVAFNDDGTIRLLNALDLSWTSLPGQEYSIDVLAAGEWIGPCVPSSLIGSATQYRLTDLCPANDQLAVLSTVESIRVCHTTNGDWGQARCQEQPFDKRRSRLFVPLQP